MTDRPHAQVHPNLLNEDVFTPIFSGPSAAPTQQPCSLVNHESAMLATQTPTPLQHNKVCILLQRPRSAFSLGVLHPFLWTSVKELAQSCQAVVKICCKLEKDVVKHPILLRKLGVPPGYKRGPHNVQLRPFSDLLLHAAYVPPLLHNNCPRNEIFSQSSVLPTPYDCTSCPSEHFAAVRECTPFVETAPKALLEPTLDNFSGNKFHLQPLCSELVPPSESSDQALLHPSRKYKPKNISVRNWMHRRLHLRPRRCQAIDTLGRSRR
mmetsp:Transcript_62811/g.147824  ORF Transcript_62811/g.147824 Transcript_62811/m.147824 type:complete len:266 (+) Transcript_62811:434-1231(+)